MNASLQIFNAKTPSQVKNYFLINCVGRNWILLPLLFFLFIQAHAQKTEKAYSLGTVKEFAGSFVDVNNANRQQLSVSVSENKHFSVVIDADNSTNGRYSVFGILPEFTRGTLYFEGDENEIKGKIIIYDHKQAYDIYTNDVGTVLIRPIDINKVVCIEYPAYEEEQAEEPSFQNEGIRSAAPELESFPGASAVIYLDFDGEYVSGGNWGTINAQASSFSDLQITQIWKMMAEDYLPFKVNVTTKRSAYESASVNRRTMVIFTPTKTASPNAGGVAQLGSFGSNSNDPCWVFNPSTKSAAEAGSHEAGHTLNLRHDGTSSSGYYSGHGSWGPIMGAVYSRPTVQWSKGEYSGANNQEDDLAIIAGTRNGFGYRTDDHGNDRTNPTLIVADQYGNISASNNQGIIERNTDVDVFEFSTSGGNVEFTVEGANDFTDHGDLDIQLRLADISGQILNTSNSDEQRSASISTNLAPGTYYLAIDGVGSGNPLNTGYSDYGSLGFYEISGSYPPGSNTEPPIVEFESEVNCNIVDFKSMIINTANEVLWDFGDGNTSTEKEPVHTYSQSGTYTVSLTATNDHGSDTETKTSYITVDIVAPPVTQGGSKCNGGEVSLTASGGGGTEYHWYDSPTGGNLLHKGTTYSPTISNTTSFYVESMEATPLQNVGATSNSIGDGAYFTANDVRGLFFDAHSTVFLESVVVYSDSAGMRKIEVLDQENGTVVVSKQVDIPSGESRVDLGFVLEKHTGYFMKVTGGVNLYRNSNGPSYPYEINNVVSITSSNAGSDALAYYYYFYDWEVQGYECNSERAPVIADVVCTDVPEASGLSDLQIYPNPVKDLLTIEGLGKVQAQSIGIFNAVGQMIQQFQNNSGGTDKTSINMESLPKGLYLIRILTPERSIEKKIMVH